MCGRYYLETHLPPEDTPESLAALEAAIPSRMRGDVRPGDEAPAVVREEEALSVQTMRWGFTGAGGGLVINARVESLREKPMFRGLVDRQRCALPAAGYYEWRDGDGQKYRIALAGRGLFCLAGLYRLGLDGREFVVVTQRPVGGIIPIHNRMPLILDTDAAIHDWLGGELPLYGNGRRLRIEAEGPEQLQMTF